jgi:hypothetical protein
MMVSFYVIGHISVKTRIIDTSNYAASRRIMMYILAGCILLGREGYEKRIIIIIVTMGYRS